MYLLRDDLTDLIRLLNDGGLLCFPTDTIWAVGCDALNETAVERLNALKGKAPDKGYILLVSDIPMLKRYVPSIHPRLETLLAYHTRPLTVVYDRNQGLPACVRAPNGSVAVRVVQEPFCQELIRTFDRPLVGTAACAAGEPWPPTFGAISSAILGGVDYVVKYRQDDREPQEPSSIARLDKHQELEFIRD
jgi:L-threonylcarbamoyladenylate synthase